ncbi:MAG: hypothetical protein ACI3YK_07230 [Eubacteriales bacterium]
MRRANPRYPLMSEIKQMYLNAYYGKHEEVSRIPLPVMPVLIAVRTVGAIIPFKRKKTAVDKKS